jgi:nicotinate phosphoribosyltransferase
VTLLALTDTFSTKAFFQVRARPTPIRPAQIPPSFATAIPVTKNLTADVERARRWHGLRQDSGDPFVFAPQAKEVYERLGINPSEKIIVYSDCLNVEKAIALKKQCDELGLNCKVSLI